MALRRMSAVILWLPMLAFAACEQSNDPVDACDARPASDGPVALSIRTDKPIYSLSTDTHATTSLVNEGAKPLYLYGEFATVQRFEVGKWTSIGPWVVADGVCITFDVQPGDTMNIPAMSFGYVGNRPGTYRFLYYLTRDPAGKHFVGETLRASPTFDLRP